jgi:hypothetical protein
MKNLNTRVILPAHLVLRFARIATFVLLSVLLLAGSAANAITYYSRQSGNWSVNATWSTVGYGNATNTGTHPGPGDVVNIGNGHTITINNTASCATLNIGQGTSGTLEFLSTGAYTLTVTGNVTVNTGATLYYNTAVNRIHRMIVGGNFANFGLVDFYVAANQVVDLTFNTTSNSTISGIGTWDLNNVTLTKTGMTTATLSVNTSNFESGMRNFIGTQGTYIHNNTGTYNINPTTATFTIGPNMVYKVPMGTMWFASAADNLMLQGALYVNGGNVLVGTTAGLQGIRSDQSGTTIPYLEVTAGNLTVYGGITYGSGSSLEPFSFRMTGGTVLLNSGTTGSNRQIFMVNDRTTSSFVMSGGTIILQKPNTAGTGTVDFHLCGSGTVTSTGGTIQFGNASTPAGARFGFRTFANVTMPHFRVTGPAANAITLAPSTGSTTNFRLLSLYIDAGKTFDIRSLAGTAADTKTMTLMGTVNGVDALYNSGTFTARSSTVTFNTSGAQAIGGTVTTTFYNLQINNSSNITLNRPANVSNLLSMVNGKLLTTNANILVCQAAANANIGTSASYVDGPMEHTVASAATVTKIFPIGKGSAYRPVSLQLTHTNASTVSYRGEIFNASASGLPYTLPPTIANVSNVRYVRFTRSAVSNFSNGKITMYYDTDDGVADKNTLLVAHDNGTSQWTNLGGTATNNWTGSITSGTFNAFRTYFALGNPPGGGNPLPIELGSFNANLIDRKVQLKWTTQAEINNSYFTVERSRDNVNFEAIGRVNGSGTTSETHNYGYFDTNPYPGISYYRIRQTDYDGTTETFPSQVINNIRKGSFTVYPNPANSPVVHLSYGDDQMQFYTITVRDIVGREIPTSVERTGNGDIRLEFPENYRKPGSIYFIIATDGIETVQQKLLIQ